MNIMMERYGICSILLLFLLINLVNCEFDNETLKELLTNEGLNTLELAKKYGYPLERHHLTTEDGYILEIHRVPYGINNTDRSNRPPVLIGHGSGGTSTEFLIMGFKSIAFRLAEAGYDVWIGNARGSKWSTKHKYLSPRSKQFWMFSWHEIGIYDYTAEIYYIINVTKQDKVFFLGHSQGATAFFAMAAEKPEINDKIRLAMLIGPTAYSKHNMNPVIMVSAENVDYINRITDFLHLYEVPSGPTLSHFLELLCKSPLRFICSGYVHITLGYDPKHMDPNFYPVLASNLPGGLSVRQLLHYGQNFRDRKFQKYDYGPEENLKLYGSVKPPLYNISKITAPVGLIYGSTDVFNDPKDVEDLAKDLPNCVFKYHIKEEMFNHAAYLAGSGADKLVTDKLIEMYNKF